MCGGAAQKRKAHILEEEVVCEERGGSDRKEWMLGRVALWKAFC